VTMNVDKFSVFHDYVVIFSSSFPNRFNL